MVRFARAEGSKGSNKKQFEEPTPWTEMVSHLEGNKKKRKKNQDGGETEKIDEIPGQTTKKRKSIANKEQEQETRPQDASQTPEDQKPDEKNEGQPMQTGQNNVKKNKKEKKKGPKVSEPEYTINSEGKRVKVFRDGTERTWFDLPYEESNTMTRYEGMWVKKVMVEELDRLKTALEDEGLDKKGIMKKMMKAKRKAHRQLRIELIYQQKSLVSEAAGEKGKSDSVSKRVNGKEKKKKKKQKPFMTGTGLLSSANTEDSMQIDEDNHKQLDEQSTVVMNTEEQMHDDNDGDRELDMTSQASGNVQKKGKRNDINSNIEKENRLEITPSRVNGNGEEGVEDNKIILATQDDCKVKKKKKSKKDKSMTETVPSQICREDNDDDDKELIVTPEVDGKTKKKRKKEKLETEAQINQIDQEEDDKVTLTPHADGKTKKKKKMKEEKLETEGLITQIEKDNCDEDNKVTITPHTDDKEKMKEDTFETEETKPQSDIKYNNETESIKSFANRREETNGLHFNKTDHVSSSKLKFEENELMTNYEGYWVLRKDVETLEGYNEIELEYIYGARTDGSKGELTEEEKVILQRAMKKRKRFYHKKLLQKVPKAGGNLNDDGWRKRSPKKEEDSGKVVKFDGFFVKKEAADRLHKLRSKLFKEGLSQQEVDKLIQKERRKEERVLKNERKLVCLNCRQPGHMVSACPNIVQADGEGQPSICYTCGSTEHTSSTCNLKKGSEKSFSFATCYICKETGHIARQCPDNPRGLYPKGGACRGCGSVEHLAKDCPDLQRESAESTIKVGRMKGEELEALDEDANEAADQDGSSTPSKWNKPKVVKF